MDKFIDLMFHIDGLRYVQRWNGFYAATRSNVAEHTLRVLWWAHCIMLAARKEAHAPTLWISLHAQVYYAAMIHDFGERFTSDVRHDVKRLFPGMKDMLDRIEGELVQMHVPQSDLFNETTQTLCVVKCADILDFTFESLNEIAAGNPAEEYHNAIRRGKKILDDMIVNEYVSSALLIHTRLLERFSYAR